MSTVVDEVRLSPGTDLRRIKVSQFSGPPVLAFHETRSAPAIVSFHANFRPIHRRTDRRVSRVFVQDKAAHSPDTLLWLLIRGFARVKYPRPTKEAGRKLSRRAIQKFRVRILKSHHGVRRICIMRHALTVTMNAPSFKFACFTFTARRFNFYRARGCNRTVGGFRDRSSHINLCYINNNYTG